MQVQMLAEIFRGSTTVAIWLGEEDSDDAWALDMISKMDDVIQSSSSHASLEALQDTLQEHPTQDPYIVIKKLFERHWWSKIWVVQEAVLAPEAILRYGDHSMSLATVYRLAQNVGTLVSTMRALVGGGFDSSVLWRSAEWQRA